MARMNPLKMFILVLTPMSSSSSVCCVDVLAWKKRRDDLYFVNEDDVQTNDIRVALFLSRFSMWNFFPGSGEEEEVSS